MAVLMGLNGPVWSAGLETTEFKTMGHVPSGAFDCTLIGKHRPNHRKFVSDLLNFQSKSPDQIVNNSSKHIFKTYSKNGKHWESKSGKLLERLIVTGPQAVEAELFISSDSANNSLTETRKFGEQSYTLLATANCQSHDNNQ